MKGKCGLDILPSLPPHRREGAASLRMVAGTMSSGPLKGDAGCKIAEEMREDGGSRVD